MTGIQNSQKQVSDLKKRKKLQKNANQFVDLNEEFKKDPKYKTELCKSYEETGTCIYGNKCRFAHGKNEIFQKTENHPKYKQKKCKAFFEIGFCKYGISCHFKHFDLKENYRRNSFYQVLLQIKEISIDDSRGSLEERSVDTTLSSSSSRCLLSSKVNFFGLDELDTTVFKTKRLSVFQSIYKNLE